MNSKNLMVTLAITLLAFSLNGQITKLNLDRSTVKVDGDTLLIFGKEGNDFRAIKLLGTNKILGECKGKNADFKRSAVILYPDAYFFGYGDIILKTDKNMKVVSEDVITKDDRKSGQNNDKNFSGRQFPFGINDGMKIIRKADHFYYKDMLISIPEAKTGGKIIFGKADDKAKFRQYATTGEFTIPFSEKLYDFSFITTNEAAFLLFKVEKEDKAYKFMERGDLYIAKIDFDKHTMATASKLEFKQDNIDLCYENFFYDKNSKSILLYGHYIVPERYKNYKIRRQYAINHGCFLMKISENGTVINQTKFDNILDRIGDYKDPVDDSRKVNVRKIVSKADGIEILTELTHEFYWNSGGAGVAPSTGNQPLAFIIYSFNTDLSQKKEPKLIEILADGDKGIRIGKDSKDTYMQRAVAFERATDDFNSIVYKYNRNMIVIRNMKDYKNVYKFSKMEASGDSQSDDDTYLGDQYFVFFKNDKELNMYIWSKNSVTVEVLKY